MTKKDSLSSEIAAKEFEFEDDKITQESLNQIKEMTLKSLIDISKLHRATQEMIDTIEVSFDINPHDNTDIVIDVNACQELLDIFNELEVQ